jgi:hypothetical protein
VRLAEDAPLHQPEFLAGGELSRAGVAGEARQMEDLVARASDPVVLGDEVAALGAPGPKYPDRDRERSSRCCELVGFRRATRPCAARTRLLG